jgi:hypothetical protein
VTLNVVEVAPAGTGTVAGTLAAAEAELSAMVAPDAGAAALSPRVQVEIAGGVTETGVQEKALSTGGCWIVTAPPLPVEDNAAPDGSDAATF